MISDYRFDRAGRPIHKDLDQLAVAITKAIHANKGSLREYPIPRTEYIKLLKYNEIYNGGSALALPHDKTNFVWRGIPVVPAES
jgi:hypothetical protein